ncbi:hypothetical protein CON28_28985 [Bacillus cereus]|nr:hypothetical protein CON28_28985 [Bacillus cereus]
MRCEYWGNEISFGNKTMYLLEKTLFVMLPIRLLMHIFYSNLNKKYAELTKYNSLSWTDGIGNSVNNNFVYYAIR